jgi:uncharacterized membrane protein YoaT (DUF817 family)
MTYPLLVFTNTCRMMRRSLNFEHGVTNTCCIMPCSFQHLCYPTLIAIYNVYTDTLSVDSRCNIQLMQTLVFAQLVVVYNANPTTLYH